jgi:hypothetical protein
MKLFSSSSLFTSSLHKNVSFENKTINQAKTLQDSHVSMWWRNERS